MMPMQPGDVTQTWADVRPIHKDFGYIPKTLVKKGVKNFVEWYTKYYSLN